MNLHGWEFQELEKEMREASVSELLEMFKQKSKLYSEKCSEYFIHAHNLEEVDKEELEKECVFYDKSRLKLALRIAENLTK